MPIDTSFYNTAPPQPTNPLQMMTSMAALQGQMQRNQLMARTMTAQQAQGHAYAQAVDPTTGQFDPDRARLLASQDPNAEYGMQGVADDTQGLSTQMTSQHIAQVQSLMAQSDRLNQIIGSVLSTAVGPDGKPDPTKLTDDVIKSGFQQAAEAGVDPKTLASEMQSMPLDPRGRYQVLQQHLAAGQQGLAQAKLIYGDVTQTDTGNTVESARVSGLGGGTLPTYTKTPQPGLTSTTDAATGQTTAIPTIQAYNTPGGVTTGQPTSLHAQQTASGGAAGQLGAQREVAIQGEMPQLMANRAAFRGLTADINNGMFNGQGAEAGLAVSKWAQAAGFKVDTTKIANTEDAVKAVARIVANIPGATHSDQLNAQAIAQNPTISKSPEGFARLTAMAQGYNDARLATVNGIRDFRSHNPNYAASDIPNLEGAVTKLNSVPMFQYNALPDQYKHTMTDNMPGATTFINNYNKAKASGLFSKGLGE